MKCIRLFFFAIVLTVVLTTIAHAADVSVLQMGVQYTSDVQGNGVQKPHLFVQYGTVPDDIPVSALERVIGTYLANGKYFLPLRGKQENGWVAITFRDPTMEELLAKDFSHMQLREENPALPQWYLQLASDVRAAINRFLVFEEGFFIYLHNETDTEAAERIAENLRHLSVHQAQ